MKTFRKISRDQLAGSGGGRFDAHSTQHCISGMEQVHPVKACDMFGAYYMQVPLGAADERDEIKHQGARMTN